MLARLVADHCGIARCYRNDLSFDETVRRHASKPQAAECGPDTMRGWWLDADPLPGIGEHPFGTDVSLDDATAQVLHDCEWTASSRMQPTPADLRRRS